MQYNDDNRGAAFPRQSDNPKAPKWSGPVKIEGRDYEISVWPQTSKSGQEYLSLKFGPPWKPKEKTDYVAPKPAAPRITDADDDQSIPF
jgi:uncharacterized protein (DUF736 family)